LHVLTSHSVVRVAPLPRSWPSPCSHWCHDHHKVHCIRECLRRRCFLYAGVSARPPAGGEVSRSSHRNSISGKTGRNQRHAYLCWACFQAFEEGGLVCRIPQTNQIPSDGPDLRLHQFFQRVVPPFCVQYGHVAADAFVRCAYHSLHNTSACNSLFDLKTAGRTLPGLRVLSTSVNRSFDIH
jgi:hypothetical protein